MKNSALKSIILFLLPAILLISGCGARGKSEKQLVKELNKNLSFDFSLLENVGNTNMGKYKVSIPTEQSVDYYLPQYEEEYQKGQKSGKYVSYSVTAYPAYTSGGHFVTMIFCSDPAISFFGVNLLFSMDNIEAAFKEAGYKPENTYNQGARSVRVKVSDTIAFGVYETADGQKYFAVGATVLKDKHTYDFFK